jgi:PAS domain S-box-containing protein
LRESEERFEKAFRASPVVNTIMRVRDSRFIDVNDAFVRMYGYSRAEAIGRTALELNLWADPADRGPLMAKLDEAGSVRGYEARGRTKAGRILNLLLFVEHIELSGEQCLLVGSYDETARRQAEDGLRRASDELKALSRRLVDVQEMQRRELSRELHDRIGQNLTALGINIDIVKARLPAGDSEVVSRLQDSIALLEATSDATVNLLSDLRPPMLDDLGLLAALEWYGKEFSARTGIEISVIGEDRVPRLEAQAEIALFRIAQEALNNVAKHANAQHVDVELTLPNGEWVLSISDDGVGLDADALTRSEAVSRFGMATMRERSLAIGGFLEVLPRPGGGTSVVVRVPST